MEHMPVDNTELIQSTTALSGSPPADQVSRLAPEIEQLVRKVGLDPATLGRKYEPNIQQAMWEFGINPLNYEAMIETVRASARTQREAHQRAGVPQAVSAPAQKSQPVAWDHKNELIARRFGLDPERVKAFRAAIQARLQQDHPRTAVSEAQHQPPPAIRFKNPEPCTEPVTASGLLSCSSK